MSAAKRSRRRAQLALLALALALPSSASAASTLTPVALRCEYLESPVGLDETQPRLTWRLESPERGQKQNAYQILVAAEEAALQSDGGDLWDSGKVASRQTVNVVYAGKPLLSRQVCWWKVKVWDRKGQDSAWSKPAVWNMGLLKAADWKAQYIGFRDPTPVYKDTKSLFLPPARQFRKEFAVAKKPIRRATI